ncbi:MAG TPA: NAD(P)/FAD-dependent oxidoreductase [Candidatus Polarisedimenticolaceae bacterium]|nr:NAD(P)/FAD-dependent oxidoreductase [Candidatus Polarisedimenticolaceae bacterium]
MGRYECVVIGGGPAGLQAALLMARGGTRAIVYDSGTARHLASAESHSFLAADGMPPAELRRRGREQLKPYGTVGFRDATVERVEPRLEGGFRVSIAGENDAVTTRFVLLATGVRDVPLAIPGFDDFWGTSILHCPYCHGWESRGLELGVLLFDEEMVDLAHKVTWWSRDVIVFVSPDLDLRPESSARLRKLDVAIETRRVRRFVGDAKARRLDAIELWDGTLVPRAAVYYRPKQRQAALVEALGSSLDLRLDAGGLVQVDDGQQTSVPGLYAAGDLTTAYQQIAEAARQGHRAASSIEHALKVDGRPADAAASGPWARDGDDLG